MCPLKNLARKGLRFKANANTGSLLARSQSPCPFPFFLAASMADSCKSYVSCILGSIYHFSTFQNGRYLKVGSWWHLPFGELCPKGLNINNSEYRLQFHKQPGLMKIHDWLIGFNLVSTQKGYIGKPIKLNGCTVEVWEWTSNLIPHFIMHVITYPCWD